jgi:hypothetical protein
MVAEKTSGGRVMSRINHKPCQGCSSLMKLLSNSRSRILLFWCPTCHRIAEQYQH